MPFAAALSEHPVAADAVGEVLGRIVELGGVEPDLVVLFASSAHVEFMGEISAAVRAVLRPGCLLGSAASAVLACGRASEDIPALAVWAAWTAPVTPLRLRARHDDGSLALDGLPDDVPEGASLLILADPYSFPSEALVDHLAATRPDLTIVGGLASAAAAPGGNALVLDGAVHRDGAVGAIIPRDQLIGPIVSQGCRPVGEPMVVTAAEGQFLVELAGRPALERLTELVGDLPPDDRVLLASGVHLGVVIDETRDTFGPGDFVVRTVLGADKEHGVLAVGDEVPVGTTVQFHVRDADSAAAELLHVLRGVHGDAALVFTCNGRGSSLFGVPDHDAAAVADQLGTEAVAGMFCAGELGPVAGRSFLHGFTASILVFSDD